MYKNKISAVYKIVNTVTGDFYIGSSKNVEGRWCNHKCPSVWEEHLNSKMYQDMQEYGLGCFSFEILEEVEPENLRQAEQKFIDTLKPTYNQMNSKGWNVERLKEYYKGYMKKYHQLEKEKQANKKYRNQLCLYNGETLTLNTLSQRFRRDGIPHPVLEAKKYLINEALSINVTN